jgi:hypothetical protein
MNLVTVYSGTHGGLIYTKDQYKKGGITRGVKDRQREEARKLGHEVKHEVGDG